ncbi:hypothetical protein JCM14076_13450 [Methylosoma difficile]
MRIFRLIGSYEFFVELSNEKKLVRIEIFEDINENFVFRTRVWLQNIYNLYPTMLNLGQNAEYLKQLYSSEHLNVEITLSIADSPEWLTGISFDCEKEFFDIVRSNVMAFFERFERI